MAWLEKRGETFRIEFRFGGRSHQVAVKTRDEATAKKCLSRFEDTLGDVHRGRLHVPAGADIGLFLLSDGRIDTPPEPSPVPDETDAKAAVTLAELFRLYQTHLTPGAKEANTRGDGPRGGQRRDHPTVRRCAGDGAVSRPPDQPGHGAKGGRHVHHGLELGQRRSHVPASCPTKGVTFPKGKEKAPFRTYDQVAGIIARGGLTKSEERSLWDGLFLSREEVAAVLALVHERVPSGWLYPFLVTAAHTGARRSELLRARVEDFDFDNRVVTLREKKKKSRAKLTLRSVDMTPLVAEVMKGFFASSHPGGMCAFGTRSNVPVSDWCSRKAFRSVVAGSKWAVLRGYHVFRHSFASNLAAAGIDEHVMGHLTAEMRARYRHLFPHQRRTAVTSVYG